MNRPVSLRVVLLVPLVLQLAITAALISLIGYQGKQQAAAQLAASSQLRASQQVREYLSDYLRTPQQVIRLMADAVASGRLDPVDRPAVIRYLWLLQRTFPDAPYLNYGWANGDFIGLGQVDNTNVRPFLETAKAGSIARLEQIRLDAAGLPAGLERIKPFGDFRSDGWYEAPVRAGRPVWTPIYNWVDAPEVMAMGAGMPIYRGGVLVGVAGVDVFLANIGRYLRSLPISETGAIYIVERDGRLVADTSGRLPFAVTEGRGVRRLAQDASDRQIRSSAAALLQRNGNFGRLDRPLQLRLPVDGAPALVRVEPYRDGQGLDWRIVVVLPESEIYGNLSKGAIGQLLVSMVAIVISGLIALLVVEFVIRRLNRLITSTDAIAEGDLSQSVELGWIQELARLAVSFNTMASRLRRSFSTLRSRNREIARLVNQRTEELASSERQLQVERQLRYNLEKSLMESAGGNLGGALADPDTGLFNRPGLERRLEGGLQSRAEAAQPQLLVLLALGATQPVPPDAAQMLLLAEQLELLAARDQGLAACIAPDRFALLLRERDGQAVLERLQPLREALQPLQLWVGIAGLAAGAEAAARTALLLRAEQALDAAIASSQAAIDAAAEHPGGLHWQIAP
jgi:HAMP domain-containing protein